MEVKIAHQFERRIQTTTIESLERPLNYQVSHRRKFNPLSGDFHISVALIAASVIECFHDYIA